MSTEAAPLVIDLGVAAAALRRRARIVAVGLILGGLTAAAILLFVPPRFTGNGLLLIRTAKTPDPAALMKDKMGALSELMPSNLGLGSSDEELATELSLLQSRAVLGAVVDSLRLEVIPRSPSRVPPAKLVDSLRFTRRFRPVKLTLRAGLNTLPFGRIWMHQPAKVKLLDREDAIDDAADRLTVHKSDGDAVSISYRARDSITAADIPNLVAAVYMYRRKTVDRGLNQRRLEFLTAKDDSVRRDLRRSTDLMASIAEQNGAGAGAEIVGKALADEIGALEANLSEIRAGEIALDSLVNSVRTDHADPRRLAGFPDLLRSPALNELIGQIASVETNRTLLLASRPESSPQAVALRFAKDSLVAQLLPIASSYRQSLGREEASIERDLAGLRAQLMRLPHQAAAVAKEEAEVTRLGAMNAGMGAQVLSARLAALDEGGDVRLIDAAVPPRRVSFPRPKWTIGICLAAGLVVGLIVALIGTPIVVVSAQES